MSEVLFDIQHLKKYFPAAGGRRVKAVDDITFQIYKGETLALVGESGCGKSTTGWMTINLTEKTSGKIFYKGKDYDALSSREFNGLRKEMQIVFQDPFASLDPRKTVYSILSEPFRVHMPQLTKRELTMRVLELMECVGLRPEQIYRYPHEFSGGQRQRIGIARAIALHPDFVVCDEPVSALDVSIQAQVINLLQDLKKQFQLTYLFISHDLRVVKHISDRVIVMYLGNIVEIGSCDSIFANRRHPYTKALLSAVPNVTDTGTERILLKGDIPSPLNPPSGCPFHPRCPYCMEQCKKEKPAPAVMEDGSMVACHLYSSSDSQP